MIIKYITANFELLLFISIEILLVIAFFLFRRYSRNHGGAFDRRVEQRRSFNRRIADNMDAMNYAVDAVKIGSSSGNELFDVSVENMLAGRRVQERRNITDRRKH